MADFEILYEDNHLLIVNKPGGMLVQGDRTGDPSLLDSAKKYIKMQYNKPGKVFLGLPHRIDRVTSGIVVLSRTSKSLSRVTQAFRERHVEKEYLAIVEGRVQGPATLKHWLLKNHKLNKVAVVPPPRTTNHQSKEGLLSYIVVESGPNYSQLSVRLSTGRAHQIRAQLAHIGHPIIGDLKYGSKTGLGKFILLHAHMLNLPHPTTQKKLSIVSAPPDNPAWRKHLLTKPKKK